MNGLELAPMRGGGGGIPPREASIDAGDGLALGSREAAIDVPDDFMGMKKEPLRPPTGFGSGSRAGSGSANRILNGYNNSSTNGGGGGVPSARRPTVPVSQQNTPQKVQPLPQPQPSSSNPSYSNHSRQPSAGSQQLLSVSSRTQPASAAPTATAPSPLVNGVKSDARDQPAAPSQWASSPPQSKPQATDDLQERARHHQEELKRRAEEQERAARERDWLQASLRESKKLQRLEHRPAPSMQIDASEIAFMWCFRYFVTKLLYNQLVISCSPTTHSKLFF